MVILETLTSIFSGLRALFFSIGIMDVIDILIVTLVIYEVLVRIRSSSALRIGSAIGVILLFTWLTSVLNLRAVNFIMTNVLEIGFIALVIVFQPELRRLLERVGTRSLKVLMNRSEQGTTDQVLEQVVSACDIMAKEKTGVLLVFQRDSVLDDYMKTGTIVDAEISSELLRNLFFTKASLHDGAVIVRNNRIAAAGCVLPLTESTAISSDLGTRHRAGIGISEVSDAVVVIVSEETGVISVAVGGMLKRGLKKETLYKLLRAELHSVIEDPDADEGILPQFRRWMTRRDMTEEGAPYEENNHDEK